MKPTLTSFSYSKTSIVLVMMLFMAYMALVYVSGFFKDWQELIIEPYFIIHGLKNYSDIATHHAPLLTEFLALIYRIFGTNILIRMILLFIVSSVTAFLTYRATLLLAGKRAGFFSVLLFTIVWPFYGGTNFWFDTFLPLFYLLAFVIIIQKSSPKYLIIAGISIGLSFLIKQTAGLVAVPIFFFLLLRPKPFFSRLIEASFFSFGVLLPIIFISLWYGYTGQLGDAIYWIFEYNLSGVYVKLGPQQPPITEIFRILFLISPIIFFLILPVFSKSSRGLISFDFILVLAIGLCSSFTIFPRWERWHVAPSIPFLVIALSFSFISIFFQTYNGLRIQKSKAIKTILMVWVIAVFLDIGTAYPPMIIDRFIPNFAANWPLRSYEQPKWVDESFRRYHRDIPEIGKYLHDMTSEGEKILVWGWQGSRIYFESRRLPAGTFYYALPWFTCLPRFKTDLIAGLENDRPCFIIVLNRRYPGTPSLVDLGINLEKKGYLKLLDLKRIYPEVDIWQYIDS